VATDIRDLLDEIRAELGSSDLHVGELGGCLSQAGRILNQLASDGVDNAVDRSRTIAARQLAAACLAAGALWQGDTRRLTQLTGVLGDVTGRLHHELTQSDRWATAIAVESIARRGARLIADAGPYDHVAELAELRDAASKLRKVAELSPPDPTRCLGMRRPIPVGALPRGLSPAQVARETVAEIFDLLHRRAGGPATTRQMASVCRAAGAVARAVEALEPELQTGAVVQRWEHAATRLSLLADGNGTPDPADRLTLCAERAARAAHLTLRAERQLTQSDVTELSVAASLLPGIAGAIDQELRVMQRSLVVPFGSEPLHEGRVAEWLHKRPFMATRDDLRVCGAAVRSARIASEQRFVPFEIRL